MQPNERRSTRENQPDVPAGPGSVHSTDDDEEQVCTIATCAELHKKERVALSILAGRESTASTYLRFFVLGVLLISLTVLSYYGFDITRDGQNSTFESNFKGFASDLITKFHLSVQKNLQGIDSLAIAITAHALKTNASFPFVTLPNFEVIAGNTRVVSWSFYFLYAPLVRSDQLEEWERYSWENRHQFLDAIEAESMQIALQDRLFDENESECQPPMELNLSNHVHNFDFEAKGQQPKAIPTDYYLPIWQHSPAVPFAEAFNFNILSHPSGPMMHEETLRTGMAALEAADTAAVDNSTTSSRNSTATYIQLLFSSSQYRRNECNSLDNEEIKPIVHDPMTPMSYPVFDSFDPVTRRVTGVLDTALSWGTYMQFVLPANAQGILCVITNAFNQTLTYEINGQTSSYLGNDDMHDPEFEYLAQSVDLNEYLASIAAKRTRSYTSVDLSPISGYKLTVYPSKETKKQFTNSDPIRNSATIVCVFVFVSAVFLSYDLFVRRHRKVLTDRAVASGAIVSSFFPSNVREKIYQNGPRCSRPRSALRNFFEREKNDPSVVVSNDVIAESFENTTIMFADVSGFTAWSKDKTPNQVFCLLESLFQAFDEIAIRLHVFKVETIGDCYVAVALVASLSGSLGSETSSLQLRVGLHSGPVTGGVLRGQKCRFQLFGSTMNQASRMESTGVPGRIHISSETATELVQCGKESWLTEREDKIEAKGLGSLTTYWVTVDSFSSYPSSPSSPRHRMVLDESGRECCAL